MTVQCTSFKCNNNRGDTGKDGSSRVCSFQSFLLKWPLILSKRLANRPIATDCVNVLYNFIYLS